MVRPTFERDTAKLVIRKRWPQGIPCDISRAELHAQVQADLKSIGCQKISSSVIDKARAEFDAELQRATAPPTTL